MTAYLSERRRLQSGAGDPSSDLFEQGRQAEARHQATEAEAWRRYEAKRAKVASRG